MKNILLEFRQNSLNLQNNRFLWPTPHIHKDIEIIYIKKGHAFAHADNNVYEVSEGDVFFCFPNQVHYYQNSAPGEYLIVIFSPDMLYNMQTIFNDFIPKNNVFHNCDAHLINGLYNENTPYKETVCAGLLNLLVPSLLSQSELIPKVKSGSSTLQSILSYCTENFTEEISLDDISRKLHISRNHISYLFNKKLNIQFNQYINSLRVNKACSLMGNSDVSLAFVSEEAGFGSIRSFNRAFKQIMGICPLKYYKQINSFKQ